MSITEQAEQTKKELLAGPINNLWELAAAILYRFGLGAGAVIALVAVLGYGTSVLWEERGSINNELKEANTRLVTHLMETNVNNAALASEMTRALTEANSAAIQNAKANERLALAIDELTREIQRERQRNGLSSN